MIRKSERDAVPGSYRDPSGFVFLREGVPFRQVNEGYRENYDCLMQSGLYKDLTSRQALVPHEEELFGESADEGAYRILRPDRIPFISFPFEWCFSQLKDAALLTLEIQERAMTFGMSLKDASAYNIQFHRSKPILIDTLSFEKYREGSPWIAYRQFCQHFLAPLSLMAKTDDRLGSLSRIFMDGTPLDLAGSLLPFSTRLNPGLLLHIHLHAKSQKAFSSKRGGAGRIKMGKAALLGIVGSLRKTVERLEWGRRKTEWSGYYDENSYGEAALAGKREIVRGLLARLKPATLWDLGANSGAFSRIASALGIETVAFDLDHGAVEANYQECRRGLTENLLPLIMDLTNPSPAIGWANLERPSLMDRGPVDACLALALIHHLAISHNLPFVLISAWFSKICRHLIVEFVPKSDPQVRRLLESREDVFSQYHEENFEASFSHDFAILERLPLPGSDRILFLLESRPS